MSDKTEKPDGDGGWVPSAEHPVPPTTEFQAVSPDAVEPIEGSAEPDETPAAAEDATTGSAPQPADAPEPVTPDAVTPAAEAATTSHPIVTPKPPAAEAPAASTPAADDAATLPPETPATPEAAAEATGSAPPPTEAPAWKTPAAAGLPPQWGDPDAEEAASETGPQPTNGVANLWGLAPEDRPEVALGAALAGGVLTAILLRTLARR